MSVEVLSIIGLVLIFLLATLRSVNMGAAAFLGTFLLGVFVLGEDPDELFAGFPGDLFAVLVGVTLLFGIAKSNGTVDWLIHAGVRAVKGRIALIPWVMFLVTSLLTMVGAVVPGAIALMAPIGLNFAFRYRISPMLMGLLIVNGGSAGGFSPISIFGSITNGVVSRNDLPGSPALLWAGSFAFNLVLSVVVFFLFGGRELLGRTASADAQAAGEGREDVDAGSSARAGTSGAANTTPPTGDSGDASTAPEHSGTRTAAVPQPAIDRLHDMRLNANRVITLSGLLLLAVGALVFDLDVGFLSISIATVLCVISPSTSKTAISQVAWPTVLLICGVVTYVSLMESMGTIDFLGDSVAGIGIPLLAAITICLIGAAVSAFASTTGILGALIPLAVPFLLTGQVGAVGMITALAISSSVVDSSPFSTSGALVVANTSEEQRDEVFRDLMVWGMSMIMIAPLVTWAIFVLPGWL